MITIQKHKKLVFSGLTAAILMTGLLGTTYAFAQGVPGDSSNLVQKIATKFGLKEAEVQAVFDQDRTDRHEEMENQYEAKLNLLVTEKKITSEQKTLILAKHKELQANRESSMGKMKALSSSEKKTAMETQRTALEKWAKENNIDVKYVMGFGGRGHWGPGMMGKPGTSPAEQSDQ